MLRHLVDRRKKREEEEEEKKARPAGNNQEDRDDGRDEDRRRRRRRLGAERMGRVTRVDWGGVGDKARARDKHDEGARVSGGRRKDDGGDDCHNDGGENGRRLCATRSEEGKHGRKRRREMGGVVACLRKGLVQACLQGDFIATSTMEAAGITPRKRICGIICGEQ
jgi:hypothetical protein